MRTKKSPAAKKMLKTLLIDESWADFLAAHIDPMFTFSKPMAKIVRIKPETTDTVSFYLQPNRHWQGFKAGQSITVQARSNGKLLERMYSLSSSPDRRYLRITVKKQGLVSTALHETWQRGMVVPISQAQGEFCLPADTHTPLLLIAGGSGITPVYSLLQTLRGKSQKAVLLYFNPTAHDVLFQTRLERLAAQNANIQVHFLYTRNPANGQPTTRLNAALLESLGIDARAVLTWLCGPASLQAAGRELWAQWGISHRLTMESFQIAARRPQESSGGAAVQVKLTRSRRELKLPGERPLLDELEDAGVYPRFGCRMGICRTCHCDKERGQVENLKDGDHSGEGREQIRLCVSRAASNLELNL
ncbi:MAG: ferredoxin reductase [Leptospiraceae bacterium]|nr:ferredoxin reductase [Leptospiraceae bacterium]